MSLHYVIWYVVRCECRQSSLGKFTPICYMSSHSIYEHQSDYYRIHVLITQDGTTHTADTRCLKVALAAAISWDCGLLVRQI